MLAMETEIHIIPYLIGLISYNQEFKHNIISNMFNLLFMFNILIFENIYRVYYIKFLFKVFAVSLILIDRIYIISMEDLMRKPLLL